MIWSEMNSILKIFPTFGKISISISKRGRILGKKKREEKLPEIEEV
jgi:hypothetical protein